MQDCSPCAGGQGDRPEFCPDRTAGKPAARAWPYGRAPVQRIVVMTRLVLSSLRAIGFAAAAVCAASALLPPAIAATKAAKPAPKSGAKEEASKPSLVATFGDWNVFVGEVGKGRICYTLAQPKSREPASLTRDPGYAFISDRPSEGVRNEVSFIMGFDVSGGDT